MSDIINWIRNTTPVWILAGQSYNSVDTIDDLAGNYYIETGVHNLSRKEKEDIILKFTPFRVFRSDFAEMVENYEEDDEYYSKFTCKECGVGKSHDLEDKSGFEGNDWTAIVTLIASHFGHTWSFFAEIEDNQDNNNYILYMDGRVA